MQDTRVLYRSAVVLLFLISACGSNGQRSSREAENGEAQARGTAKASGNAQGRTTKNEEIDRKGSPAHKPAEKKGTLVYYYMPG